MSIARSWRRPPRSRRRAGRGRSRTWSAGRRRTRGARCSPAPAPGSTRIPIGVPGARRPNRSIWLIASRLSWIAVGEEDVEVALGDVRAGVADLVGPPAAGERALDLARRAGVDPDAVRRPGAPRPRKTARTSGSGLALSANRTRYGSPVRGERGLERAGRSRRTGAGRRRTAASRARGRGPRRPAGDRAAGRPRCRARGGPTTGAGAVTDACRSVRPAGQARMPRRGHGRVRVRASDRTRPGSSGSGPSSTATPSASSSRLDAAAISAIAASNASALRADGLAEAADLADVLEGGGLQLAGRRGLVGATQGLDASAHAMRVHRISAYATARWTQPRGDAGCPRVVLVGAGVAVGLVLAVGVDVARSGGPGGWLARHRLPAPYIAAGQRIDIGGRSLYLDCRGSGSPTVVLEAGSGSDSATWAAVHDELAATTRTCAYDRPGADGATRGRGTRSPTRPRTSARCWRRRASQARSSWSATRSAARTAASSRRPTGARSPAWCSSMPSTRTSRRAGSTRSSGRCATSTGPGSTGCAPTSAVDSLDWAASEAQLRASSVAGLPSRSSWRRGRAAPRRGDQRRHRRGVAGRIRVAVARPRRPHDRVGRRPQHPGRPPRPRHRVGPAPGG